MMVFSLILFCLFVAWLLVPITPPTTSLNVQYVTDGTDTEILVKWKDGVDEGIPFVVDITLSELKFVDFPYKKVFTPTSHLWRSGYFARTDAYPLAWLQWWIIFRIEESRRLVELVIMYVLQTWGLVKVEPGRLPQVKDLLTKK